MHHLVHHPALRGRRVAIKQARLRGVADHYFASPVAADGKIFITSQSGIVTVLKAGGVARIDLIRGGQPGVDMQGKAVVANVIRKSGGGFRALLDGDVLAPPRRRYSRNAFPARKAAS